MKILHRHLMLATALAAGLAVAPFAHAADGTSGETDPGFTPDTGQINPGVDKKNPSTAEARKIPTPAEARAAKMMPVSTQPLLGAGPTAQQAGPTPPAAGDQPDVQQQQSQGSQSGSQSGGGTTGSGGASKATAQTSEGPIGAIGETMPSKFSERNDILDRVPTMAMPMKLSDQERQRIYQAVMADKTQAAAGADALEPASLLSTEQALNETHPLPASLADIVAVKRLSYVKAKNKVLLVEPDTRVVFEQITS
jgi:hypothetical protein